MRYLDLRSSDRRGLPAPHGVVEFQDGPLAYVVDATEKPVTKDGVGSLCRALGFRGDAPYLAIVEPGRLIVHGVSLDLRRDRNVVLRTPHGRSGSATFHLLHLQPPPRDPRRRAVQKVLFELFSKAVEGLTEQKGVSQSDAISLAGRALFTRFLVDRGIVDEAELATIHPGVDGPEHLFCDASHVETTCAWLDSTFNGDFLPLAETDFSKISVGTFWHLSNIMGRSPGGQRTFDWATVDFSYVPIEVLSQVYEWAAERWDPTLRKQRSMYFTPLRIARHMVREIFTALESQGPTAPHLARVLDPAVGGGVFLVAAFREICAAWWRHHERPPDTHEIRSILETQLAGFDIHEPALRLAALGLYLTAIELDQNPKPLEKLGFSPLRGSALFMARRQDEPEKALTIGSLSLLKDNLHHEYDVVIGNPPWTSLSDARFEDTEHAKDVHSRMVEAIRPIVAQRLGADRARRFGIPDLVPDLPFVWASMKWARPGGWIALALHGRVLFKQSPPGRRAREDIFSALEITGVLNGADLRETKVWPGMRAPFCLLFCRNEVPRNHSAFFFVSPHRESAINRQSRLRIDAKSAHPITVKRFLSAPYVLKALFRGTALDLALVEKMSHTKGTVSVGDYWEHLNLRSSMGQGYQVKGPAYSKPSPAGFLKDYPSLETGSRADFLVDTGKLPIFPYAQVHRPRTEKIYAPPLLILRRSLSLDREQCRAMVAFSRVAYSKSFFGYSAAEIEGGDSLVRYLTILIHSKIFMWHILMISSRFAVERDTVQKETVDRFPFVPVALLGEKKHAIKELSDALFRRAVDWEQLDEWVASIYGLTRWDLEVISDTLEVGLSFEALNRRPDRKPQQDEIEAFIHRLRVEIEPFVLPDSTTVHIEDAGPVHPWVVLVVEFGGRRPAARRDGLKLYKIFRQADSLGASQIVIPDPETKSLAIAILRQYRYWTSTRARLLALEILEEHLEKITG